MTDKEIANMLARLDAMGPKFHALPDGRGIYLGDGQAYPKGQELRSVPLASVLRESLAWRNRYSAESFYDPESGDIRAVA